MTSAMTTTSQPRETFCKSDSTSFRSMTSAMTTTSQPRETFCKSDSTSFSIVVDDVDARTADDSDVLHKLLTDTSLDLRTRSQTQFTDSKEESDARIRQIQGEAENRKMEFARLLEEHAQVIRKLKQMEEDGAALGSPHA